MNHGGLEIVVIMSKAELPEAGDAVMTFPAPILADPERCRAARLHTHDVTYPIVRRP